jgi:hypothetical protein
VLPAERAEVELAERFLDQALLIVVVERLAGHLLGGEDRQVGDLGADLLDRAARLGLDVATRLLEQLLALGPRPLDCLALAHLAGLARAGDDLLGLGARLAQPGAVLLEQRGRIGTRALRRLDRLLDRPLALLERLGDGGPRVLAQDEERHQEGEERPDHQPHIGTDEEVARLLLCGLGQRRDDREHGAPSRGRRRSGRR